MGCAARLLWRVGADRRAVSVPCRGLRLGQDRGPEVGHEWGLLHRSPVQQQRERGTVSSVVL